MSGNCMVSIDELRLIYGDGKRISPRTDLSKYIKRLTPYLPLSAFPKQRLWHILNDTNDIPTCKMCSKLVRWDNALPIKLQHYRVYCSHKCLHTDPDQQTKKRTTELLRFGRGRSSVVDKIKKTNQERYGVDFAIQSGVVQERRRHTNIKRYGVGNVMQSATVVQTRKETNVAKFGVVAPILNKGVKAEMESSIIRKYGSVDARYKVARLVYKETCALRYGVTSHNQSHYSDGVLHLLSDKDRLYAMHKNDRMSQTSIAKELQVAQSTIGRYFNRHGINTMRFSVSGPELELLTFIQSLLPTDDIVTNTRDVITPLELDIYIPSLNLAIEFNGLYWHSELCGKGKKYHLNKTLECEKKNIRLIHVFENEWNNKRDVVKSRLMNILQKNTTRIFARKCVVSSGVSAADTRIFMNENHIQGYAPSSVNISLVYGNDIVAMMTFSRSRFNKKYQYELIRYVVKRGYSVVGGASKAFNHFKKTSNPTSVITYSDNRWNTGKLYSTIGFTYLHTAAPNYFYFKDGSTQLWSRVHFQKHKLEKQLTVFDPILTEWENMMANGYNRIWDCGNKVYAWESIAL